MEIANRMSWLLSLRAPPTLVSSAEVDGHAVEAYRTKRKSSALMAGTAAPPESPPRSSPASPACRDERLRTVRGRRAARARSLAARRSCRSRRCPSRPGGWSATASPGGATDRRQHVGARDGVVEERAGQELARFAVIVHTLVQRLADALDARVAAGHRSRFSGPVVVRVRALWGLREESPDPHHGCAERKY